MPEDIEIENTPLPTVRVMENGKPVDTSSIDNYDGFMQYLLQASMTARINKMAKIAEDEHSEGWVQNFGPLLVDDTEPSREVLIDYPAQSLFLINTGPAIVYVGINHRYHTSTPVNPGQPYSLEFKGHKLERFFVQCPLGQTATLSPCVAKG
jgi:hypothetical protein